VQHRGSDAPRARHDGAAGGTIRAAPTWASASPNKQQLACRTHTLVRASRPSLSSPEVRDSLLRLSRGHETTPRLDQGQGESSLVLLRPPSPPTKIKPGSGIVCARFVDLRA